MSKEFELKITNDANVLERVLLSDNVSVSDYLDSVRCLIYCTDTETKKNAFIDSWVPLAKPSERSSEGYIAFSEMSEIPERIKNKLLTWKNDFLASNEHIKRQLENDVDALNNEPKIVTASWPDESPST